MSSVMEPFVFAVQNAVLDLFESVEQLSDEEAEKETLRKNAEKTVLRFIAAIILADGKYRDGERALVAQLVDWTAKPGGEHRYLNEYAARWTETSTQIPRFFDAAVKFDIKRQTNIARAMLRNIQLIGNNVSACDGKCGETGRRMVRDYLRLLDEFHDSMKVSCRHACKELPDGTRSDAAAYDEDLGQRAKQIAEEIKGRAGP